RLGRSASNQEVFTVPRPRSDRAVPKKPAAPRPVTPPAAPSGSYALLPSFRQLFDPRGPFLIPLLLLFLSRVLMLIQTPAAAEDSFITFRYARNLAAGQGLVYNPGEHVMGFTSPLWTVWSALGIAVVGTPITWALVWTVIADLCTLIVGGTLVGAAAGAASAW